MLRRVMLSMVLGAFAASASSASSLDTDRERLLSHMSELAKFGRDVAGGINRLAYSDADIASRQYLTTLMRDAGLEVHVDAAGNIIGRMTGAKRDSVPIVLGSHADTVPSGGAFDGALGVIAAIEVAQVLREHAVITQHPLEVIVFADEEGGTVGSQALTGHLAREALEVTSQSGFSIREGMRRIGGDPANLLQAVKRPGEFLAYLELHIEQGPTLFENKINIGVVEGIVGIHTWDVTVTGVSNHAGTTPMDRRQDALLAAAQLVLAVNRVIRSSPGTQVGTVGRIQAFPGASNVIPGQVNMSLEIRDLSNDRITTLFKRLLLEAQNIQTQTKTTIEFKLSPIRDIAKTTAPAIRSLIESAAEARGLSSKRMPSGAGHDAQAIAEIAPIGMIFVPSVNGVSHSPNEYTSPEDVFNGANVLLDVVRKVDETELK